jgi:hypothetical protein
MKNIILTVLVCLDVAGFAALYRRTTEIVVQTLLEGLSQISASRECCVSRDLIRPEVNPGLHKLTVRLFK